MHQVLATKPLSDGKYRLKLNDGKDTFVHAVLDTGDTVQVPAKFSVIRISSEETPDHIKNPTIMSISKDNKDKFALIEQGAVITKGELYQWFDEIMN